jgi:sec-independent protein translocase protein TatA
VFSGLENPVHLAILLLIVLLVFGAKRLPEIGRGIGQGMREFKDSVSGAASEPSAERREALAAPQEAPVAQPAAQAAVATPAAAEQPAPQQEPARADGA